MATGWSRTLPQKSCLPSIEPSWIGSLTLEFDRRAGAGCTRARDRDADLLCAPGTSQARRGFDLSLLRKTGTSGEPNAVRTRARPSRGRLARLVGSLAPRDPASERIAPEAVGCAAMSQETVDDLIQRALEAYDALSPRRGDRGRVDVRHRPRGRLAGAPRGPWPPPGAPSRPRAQAAAIARAIDEIGMIRDPHRAIDWLSTFPQVVLVALGRTVRFQDAAKDARAIVYAGIQADPSVAMRLPCSPTRRWPSVSGPGRDERRDADPDAWRTMFPTLLGPDVARGDPRPLGGDPRARRSRSRTGGTRYGPGPRRDRGILTACSSPTRRRRTVRRERRILFDGVTARSTRTT